MSGINMLDHLLAYKRKVEWAYNKHIRLKNFLVGDLVWKANLIIGYKDLRFGKWPLN
jgi:hypothetical protein